MHELLVAVAVKANLLLTFCDSFGPSRANGLHHHRDFRSHVAVVEKQATRAVTVVLPVVRLNVRMDYQALFSDANLWDAPKSTICDVVQS
jgi:hypothetical protein